MSCEVEKILVKNNKIQGVQVGSGDIFLAPTVVSSIDVRQTVLKLLNEDSADVNLLSKVNNLEPAISSYMVFLGVSKKLDDLEYKTKYWCSFSHHLDERFQSLALGDISSIDQHILLSFPSAYEEKLAPSGMESICILTSVPYLDENFWKKNRLEIRDRLINRVESLIPSIKGNILVCETATPVTYRRFTGNQQGSSYGWACVPTQVVRESIQQKTNIQGLYLNGHWTNSGFGVSRVALSGYNAARLVLSQQIAKNVVQLN